MFDLYIKEREDFETIKNDKGFAIYKILGDECYIKDIFVLKEYRKDGVASALADDIAKIAKDQGCNFLSGSVSLECGDPTASIKVLLAYGFQVVTFHNGLLWFKKGV